MLCCSGVCEGVQVEEVTLLSKTVSKSLVWALCINDSGIWFLLRKKRPLYFSEYGTERGSFWLCM